MTADVINIADGRGPPETDFEREAVDVLLSSIRKFRAEAGQDPESLVYVICRDAEKAIWSRKGHYMASANSVRLHQAYAAAILYKEAVSD